MHTRTLTHTHIIPTHICTATPQERRLQMSDGRCLGKLRKSVSPEGEGEGGGGRERISGRSSNSNKSLSINYCNAKRSRLALTLSCIVCTIN